MVGDVFYVAVHEALLQCGHHTNRRLTTEVR